jgi:hypothetical protein
MGWCAKQGQVGVARMMANSLSANELRNPDDRLGMRGKTKPNCIGRLEAAGQRKSVGLCKTKPISGWPAGSGGPGAQNKPNFRPWECPLLISTESRRAEVVTCGGQRTGLCIRRSTR